MIIVANRRRKQEKLLQEYPGAIIEGIKRKTERHSLYTPLIGQMCYLCEARAGRDDSYCASVGCPPSSLPCATVESVIEI